MRIVYGKVRPGDVINGKYGWQRITSVAVARDHGPDTIILKYANRNFEFVNVYDTVEYRHLTERPHIPEF